MIKAKLAQRIAGLTEDRIPFVLATVVRARKPTSVHPGDTAVVLGDGTIEGFVGGQCAESSVRLYSLRALETGEPVLLRLVPGDEQADDGGPVSDGIDGAVVEHNPCLSGGALEIFIEPQLPAARVVIVGGSPIALALEALATAAGYAAVRCRASQVEDLDGAAAVIVAAHGNEEEPVLARALSAGVPYVALVASRVRGEAVRAELDLPGELARQLHTPAGLDLGASTPAEVAVSILAQLVACQHADPAPGRPAVTAGVTAAVEPVCGMEVVVSAGTAQLVEDGRTVYFCGPGCRDAYARLHA